MSTCKRMWTDREIRSMAGDTAKTLIEAGQTENAKPIYYHGLEMYRSGTNVFYMHILNNDPTPIDTLTKLLNWFQSFGDKKVIAQGNGLAIIEGTNYQILSIYKPANSNKLNMIASASSGYTILNEIELSTYFDTYTDGVNKIN